MAFGVAHIPLVAPVPNEMPKTILFPRPYLHTNADPMGKSTPELGERFQRRLLNGFQFGPDLDRRVLFDGFSKETAELLKSMLVVEFAVIQEQMNGGWEGEDIARESVEAFARQMTYSHVIHLASVFETYLSRACATLRQARGEAAWGLEKLQGKTIRKRFLERCGRFRVDGAQWDTAILLSALREVLVEGVSAAPPQLMARLSALDGIRIEKHKVVVEPIYVRSVSESLKQLIESIYSGVSKAIPKRFVTSLPGASQRRWIDGAGDQGGRTLGR